MASSGYRRSADLPVQLALFPLDGALLLPGGVLPLQIFEPRYLNMIDDVMTGDRLIGMVQTDGGGDRRQPGLAEVGCAGRVTSYSETGDGKYLIALTGICRFRLGEELALKTPYRVARADFAPFLADLGDDDGVEFERGSFLSVLRRYLDKRGLGVEWEVVSQAPGPALINSLAMALPFPRVEKQALLEAADIDERRAVLAMLMEMDAARPHDDDDAAPAMQ